MNNIFTQEQKDRLRCTLDDYTTCDKCSVDNSEDPCARYDEEILKILIENKLV
jgi:hypothetical protein